MLETFPNAGTPEFWVWVYHFQTLIGGLLALLAALATILFLNWQKQTEIEAKHRMLRAGLPIALSQIGRYANACIHYIGQIAYFSDAEGQLGQDVEEPSFPSNAFKDVQKIIETIDEDEYFEFLNLMNFSQIQNSRFGNSAFESVGGNHESWKPGESKMYALMEDALLLSAAIDRIFPYARNPSNQFGEWRSADSALSFMPITINGPTNEAYSFPNYQKLEEYVKRNWASAIERHFSKGSYSPVN